MSFVLTGMIVSFLMAGCVSGPNDVRHVFRTPGAAPETVRRDVAACKLQGTIAQSRADGGNSIGSARAAFRYCLESKGYVYLRREWYEGPVEGDLFGHRFAAS